MDYEPHVPNNKNGTFIAWEDPLTEAVNTSLKKEYITQSARFIATWSPITYTVNMVYVYNLTRDVTGLDIENNNQMQSVISGNLINPPDIPSDLSQASWRLKGWYYYDPTGIDADNNILKDKDGNIVENAVKYKFELNDLPFSEGDTTKIFLTALYGTFIPWNVSSASQKVEKGASVQCVL